MSELENSDDETDEVYTPPERENESDCDKYNAITNSWLDDKLPLAGL